jgi:glycosyltransferase involved in cell wall biosynthesis
MFKRKKSKTQVNSSSAVTKANNMSKSNTKLDIDFYKSLYSDLVALSEQELIAHWNNFGKKEGRFANLKDYVAQSPDMQFDLDLAFYTHFYPDLAQANITTLEDAKVHWFNYGKNEGRLTNLNNWFEKNKHVGLAFNIVEYDFENVIALNTDLAVTLVNFLDMALGVVGKPIRLYESAEKNATFYKHLGLNIYNQYKATGDQSKLHNARSAWRIACYFKQSNEIMEIIAGTYFEQSDFRTAQKAYEHGYAINNKMSFGALESLLACFEKLTNITSGLRFLIKYNQDNPEQTVALEWIDNFCKKLYDDNLGEMQVLGNLDKRNALINCAEKYTDPIYNAYYQYYSIEQNIPLKSNLNTERVLIIGDYHIPQCIRYRIDQKVEQLESQGKTVTTINWTELEQSYNQVALHDIVIFYRTPAVPSVLKALAQVNANGKASFFEIDDLLFEPSYPAPIETFGGYVDISTHIELRKAPASFAALAKRCRFGIASTELLREKLAKLVSSNICLLHRNGLDEHNYFTNFKKPDKKTIDIFYGSGTQAHNTDFTELALPALEQVLSTNNSVRLIIAGYLELPQSFKQRFKTQLLTVPPVKSIKAYWNLLEQADINLAILNDDIVNGCKSELKWFEAACLGVPSIVSSTANYRDVINHGEDALMVATVSEWTDALTSLINSKELRVNIATKSLERVKTEYTAEALGEKLVADIANTVGVTAKPKKKIALVNVFFPPQSIGGATRVLSDNFDILQKQYGDDFELVVFTSDERCTTPYKLETYQHQGVTVYRSTILFRENMDWHPKDENMYDLFEEFLQLEQPDLVHFHCVQRLTASVVEATKNNNIPYIVTAHDAWWISDHQFLIDQKDNVYPNGHPDMFAPRVLPNNVSLSDSIERINYYKELLNGATKLLTVSECFADIYAQNGYPNIVVNKNGISSTVQWEPKNTDYTDNVVCAHIGGMANHKGYFLLKEAIEQLQPKNLEMLIVDHSKEQGYEHKTNWGKVPVTFIGRVNQQGVVNLYQKIDVLFAPSLWPESYGLVTREAAASGCWVVASTLGGIGEDVIEGKTGFKVTPTLKSLSEVINKLDANNTQFKNNIQQVDIRIADEQVVELTEMYK